MDEITPARIAAGVEALQASYIPLTEVSPELLQCIAVDEFHRQLDGHLPRTPRFQFATDLKTMMSALEEQRDKTGWETYDRMSRDILGPTPRGGPSDVERMAMASMIREDAAQLVFQLD